MSTNDSNIKSKAFAISTLMGDPKLSKIIEDGINAPIGSTKKVKAKAILASLNKVESNYNNANDGQGQGEPTGNIFTKLNPFNFSGFKIIPTVNIKQPTSSFQPYIDPNTGQMITAQSVGQTQGQPEQTGYVSPLDKLTTSFKNLQFAPETSKLSAIPYKEKEVSSGISGINAPITGKEIMVPGKTNIGTLTTIPNIPYEDPTKVSSKLSPALINIANQVKELTSTVKQEEIKTSGSLSELSSSLLPENFKINIQLGAGKTNNNPGNLRLAGQAGASQGVNNFARFETPEIGFAALMNDLNSKKAEGGNLNSNSTIRELVNIYAPAKDNNDVDAYVNALTSDLKVNENTKIGDILTFDLAVAIAKHESGSIVSVGDTSYAYGDYSKLPKREAYSGYLDQANLTGIGSKAYAANVLSNPELLKQSGLSESILKYLSEGTPAAQIAKLEETLKAETKLDEQLAALNAKTVAGMTLEGDLTGFIAARDTYLNKLDDLRTKAQQMSVDKDMSDPVDRKRMNNYMNYLALLEGRQNQRYSGYLKTSIDQWNADITRDTNLYNTTLTNVENRIKRGTDVIEDVYDQATEILEGLYNAADVLDQRQADKTKAEAEAYKLSLSNIELYKKVALGGEGDLITPSFAATNSLPPSTTTEEVGMIDSAINKANVLYPNFTVEQKKAEINKVLKAAGWDNYTWDSYLNIKLRKSATGVVWEDYIDSILTDEAVKETFSIFGGNIAKKREELKNEYLEQVNSLKKAGRTDDEIFSIVFKVSK